MKILIIVLSIFIFNTSLLFSAIIPKWNPCINAARNRNFRSLKLDSSDMETCFNSAMVLLDDYKTKKQGVYLMSKFLYLNHDGYRRGAVLQLGNSSSADAIKVLVQKGKHAVRTNNAGDLELITLSLVTLNGHTAARELASYAKSKKKGIMLRTIANEYLVYTKNSNFLRMEKITGEILD